MSSETTTYQCSRCSKRYKRLVHLQRHAITHTAYRPYSCEVCNHSFQRADVYKRHRRTCGTLNHGQLTSSSLRRACDYCVRNKRGCNLENPCSVCKQRNITCTYSFDKSIQTPLHTSHKPDSQSLSSSSAVGGSYPLPKPPGADFQNVQDMSWTFDTLFASDQLDFADIDFQQFLDIVPTSPNPQPLQPSENGLFVFRFLDNFTSQTGLVSSFDCLSLEDRRKVVMNFCARNSSSDQSNALKLDPYSADLSPSAELLSVDIDGTQKGLLYSPWDATSPTDTQRLNDPFALKTHEIIVRIREVATIKPRNSAVNLIWSTFLENICLQFFAPSNLRKFIELYFAIWHPNVNFLHRPSFDPLLAKPPLLASMALIGATMSPDVSDNENAKTWFNCVEEMVFTDDELCEDLEAASNRPSQATVVRSKVQALQAAYMVCLYQNWDGNDASRRRIRRYRYSTVVAVVRDIGIVNCAHSDYDSNLSPQAMWKDFIAREEMIRTALWIFLLDTAFVIFNNLPPRMMIKEMKMHVAATELSFQAESAEEWLSVHQLIVLEGHPSTASRLSSIVEQISRTNLTQDACTTLADLGSLNLFAVTSSVNSLIFQYQNSLSSERQMLPIRNALANLKTIWELHYDQFSHHPWHLTISRDDLSPDNMWKRIGFCRFASEYWLLAKIITDRVTERSYRLSPNDDLADIDASSTPHDGNETPMDPVLQRYDETSMQQVNDLIAGFHNVQI